MNEWSLLFFEYLVIPPFEISLVDPGAEFPRAAVAAGNLTSNSRCLVVIPKNVGTNSFRGDQGYWSWASDHTSKAEVLRGMVQTIMQMRAKVCIIKMPVFFLRFKASIEGKSLIYGLFGC